MIWLRIAFFTVALSLVTLVLAPFQIAFILLGVKLQRRLPRLWHRIACWLLGVRVHVHGSIDRRRPLMLASNHASWKDILVLSSIADMVFIAKVEVKDWPVFGVLARLQNTIFISRDQKRRTGDQVNDIARRLTGGEIVVLFPEGTTSDGNRVLEIKSSLFGAASAAVPFTPEKVVYVQPVAIAYTRIQGVPMGRYHRPIAAWPGDITLMPSLLGILKSGPLDVEVTFGDSVEFREGSNRKMLSGTVETSIRRMLLDSLRGR